MMPYLTILRVIWPYLIAAAIGGAVVGKIQQIRINHVTADLQTARQELSVCQDVNKTNQNSIESLKKEVKAAYSACDSRLQIKDKTLRNIQRIDAIPGKHGSGTLLKREERGTSPQLADRQKGAADEKINDSSGTSDALLNELNRMYPGEPDRQN